MTAMLQWRCSTTGTSKNLRHDIAQESQWAAKKQKGMAAGDEKKKEKMESVLFGKDVDLFGPAGDERVGVGARKSARTLAPAAAVAELGELFVEVGAEDVHIGPGWRPVSAGPQPGPHVGTRVGSRRRGTVWRVFVMYLRKTSTRLSFKNSSGSRRFTSPTVRVTCNEKVVCLLSTKQVSADDRCSTTTQ